jgi:tetratricopeptide (TPR) repeat protein
MGQAQEQIPRLRRLFMGTLHPRNRCTAAYNIAEAYRDLEDFENAMEWAERSSELARTIDEPSLTAGVHNQQASLALRFSRFDEAEEGFHRALESMESLGESFQVAGRATVVGNLGYALMCTDRLEEGLGLCEQAHAALEDLSADHLIYENLQDLCYGYILDNQLERAHAAGERALALAERYDDNQVMKNCLFLLAEVAVRRGDAFRGRRYLRELAEFYPEIGMNEEIIDVFLTTDLTNVVNLRG